jgi:hypothetical protein
VGACLGLGLSDVQAQQGEVTRIAGDYRVAEIQPIHQGNSFRITFVHEAGEPYERLILESDHIHVGIEQGQTIRLAAEVLEEHEKYAEIAQVLLFLPTDYGQTPVWMLSRKKPSLELRGAPLIEMHAPAADYAIF